MIPLAEVTSECEALGFELSGVCAADAPLHIDALTQWVENGFAGTMDYMRRHLPLRRSPTELLEGAQSVIAVGLNYYQDLPSGQAKRARYALGRDYHKVIRAKLRKLERKLAEEHPGAGFRICVDSAPLLERELAHLAGLGWFGKNTMLINSKRGSWFLLGFLITTLTIEVSKPSEGGCGTCRACIDACPTGAIVHQNGRWQVDSRKCISYLTIENREPDLTENTQGWVFGCDVCQEVCPFNHPRPNQPLRAQPTREPDFQNVIPWPTREALEILTEVEWERITEGSATRRAKRNQLIRNAKRAGEVS